MINRLKFFISTLLVLFVSTANAAETPLPTLAPVLKTVMPAIVNVAVQGYLPESISPPGQGDEKRSAAVPEKGRKFESIGSGVIIDPNAGVIITNDHVIRNATLITVTLQDGRHLKAKLLGGDGETDLAILKVDAKNLKSLPLGDSDKLQMGFQ